MLRTISPAIAVALALSIAGGAHARSREPELWSRQKVLTVGAKPLTALYQALAADAALPRATSDRERLERLGRIDQSWRDHMGELDVAGLTPEETRAVYALIAARTEPVDRANLAAVLAMRPKDGWFTISAYGREASEAAFHIVQHGDEQARARVLPFIAQAAERGEVDGQEFAKMYDRVQTDQGKPQRYGTQFHCVANRMVPRPLEDEARVEALRAPFNLGVTFAEHVRGVAKTSRC